jgi:hypothetical protein
MLKRRRDGLYELRLAADDRAFLAGLADQMDQLLDEAPDDPSLRRLSPPAYLDDIVREAEYQVFMAEDLRASRRASLDVLRETAQRTELTEEEVVRWMQAINAIRLVLGTRLGIDSDEYEVDVDEDDPVASTWALYDVLSMLLEQAVRALSSQL